MLFLEYLMLFLITLLWCRSFAICAGVGSENQSFHVKYRWTPQSKLLWLSGLCIGHLIEL